MEKLQSSYKHILKPAWLILAFLLSVMVWGQETTKDNYSGTFSDGDSWEDGSAPASPYANQQLLIYGEITHIGDLTFNNLTSLEINDTLIVEGSISSDDGAITISNGGLLIVKSDFTQMASGSITIQDGGRLIVYNSANIDCNLTVSGQLNVSGNFNYDIDNPGRDFYVESTGSVIVGGDFNAEGSTVVFISGSYLGVLGNAEFPDGNFPTQDGEFDVLGETTGTNVPSTVSAQIDPGAPILSSDITYGMHVIAFLTEGDILDVPYTNNSSSAYTGVIWESTNYTTSCHRNVQASADVTLSSGLTYGTEVYLQYSIDDGINWSDENSFTEYATGMYRCDNIEASAGYIQVRLYANNMPDGATASLDNVTIAATNEGGTPATAIEWGEFADDICTTEIVVYSIVDHSYSSIVWSVEYGDGIIVSGQGETECEVEWMNMPEDYGTILVTVTGGECGGSSQTLYSERKVSQTDHLKVFVDKTDITCRDADDGTISIEGRCGGATVTYVWLSGPTGFTLPADGATSVNNLGSGTYRVQVSDGIDTETVDIQIINPSTLTVNLSAPKPYDCSNNPGGDGELSLGVSGGWAPYDTTITINSLAYTGELNAAPAGTYQVEIEDSLGCVQSSSEVTIDQDSENPQFVTFPDNYQVDIATYNADNAENVEVLNVLPNQNYNASGLYNTSPGVDLSRYRNFTYTIGMSGNGSTPAAGDSVSVYVSYNGGGDYIFIEKYSAYDDATSITGEIALDGHPNDYADFVLRVSVAIETSGLEYTLDNINVVADERVHHLDPSVTNGTPTCSDDVSGCASSYTDSELNWGTCTDYDTGEFYFERTWTILDNCGKSNTRTQIVGVGTPPTITAADDMIVDFCNNENIQVPVPTYNDDCGVASVSWEVTDNASGASPSSGSINETDTHIGLTLNHPLAGESDIVYTLTWTVTDDAGFTASVNQSVTILKPITIALTPDKTDFCSGEEVSFEFTIDGGTRSYGTVQLTSPSETLTGSGNTYSFTTSSLELVGTDNIAIDVTDSDVSNYEGGIYSVQGGCPKTITFENGVDNGDGIPFTIHQNISTNPLERVD